MTQHNYYGTSVMSQFEKTENDCDLIRTINVYALWLLNE